VARHVVESEAQRHRWPVEVDLRRWHPIAEEWEDPDEAMPADEAAMATEREALMAREREETTRRGYPEFEVRVDLPSRHDAVSLSERLRTEGIPAVHRWRYLLVGATDEDSAEALAQRIRAEVPAGSRVKVEGTWAALYGRGVASPFAVLDALGG
jgi:hypothetical protein